MIKKTIITCVLLGLMFALLSWSKAHEARMLLTFDCIQDQAKTQGFKGTEREKYDTFINYCNQ